MKLGNWGEEQALAYLEDKGYKLLEKNYRYRNGEIDLIMKDKHTIVFVEVKTRTSQRYGLPRESVDSHKQRQIYETAKMYIHQEKLYYSFFRFDVIEILVGVQEEVYHIQNAFNGNDLEG